MSKIGETGGKRERLYIPTNILHAFYIMLFNQSSQQSHEAGIIPHKPLSPLYRGRLHLQGDLGSCGCTRWSRDLTLAWLTPVSAPCSAANPGVTPTVTANTAENLRLHQQVASKYGREHECRGRTWKRQDIWIYLALPPNLGQFPHLMIGVGGPVL